MRSNVRLIGFSSLTVAIGLAACSDDPAAPADPTMTVEPAELVLVVASTAGLQATVLGGNGEPLAASVTWSSEDTLVAVVDAEGVVQGVGIGSTRILAQSDNGAAAEAAVTVVSPVASLSITAPDSILLGASFEPVVVAIGQDGEPMEDLDLSWEVSDSLVLRAEEDGILGVGWGDALLIGEAEGVADTVEVQVRFRRYGADQAWAQMHIWSANCAITVDGAPHCWGAGHLNTLIGIPRADEPVPVAGDHSFISIATGSRHACGLTEDGSAWCWGTNMYGQLGQGQLPNDMDPPLWTSHEPLRVAFDGNIKQLTAGGHSHTCIADEDDVPYCWGHNDRYQLGRGPLAGGLAEIDVSFGGIPTREISAGDMHTCFIAVSGDGYCVGSVRFAPESGPVSPNPTPDPVRIPVSGGFKSLKAGLHRTCGIANDGVTYCWGVGEVGTGPDQVPSNSEVRPVLGGHRFVSVSNGWLYSCAIDEDRAAFCWGRNLDGELGHLHTSTATEPVRVPGPHRWRQIVASPIHRTCGITEDDEIYCWGVGAVAPDN